MGFHFVVAVGAICPCVNGDSMSHPSEVVIMNVRGCASTLHYNPQDGHSDLLGSSEERPWPPSNVMILKVVFSSVRPCVCRAGSFGSHSPARRRCRCQGTPWASIQAPARDPEVSLGSSAEIRRNCANGSAAALFGVTTPKMGAAKSPGAKSSPKIH